MATQALLLSPRYFWICAALSYSRSILRRLVRRRVFRGSAALDHRTSCQSPRLFPSGTTNAKPLQSTFCINSIAHWLGTAPYDDVQTPRDHLLSAILTMGEGYHNFHHQFPMDYRNAFLWYQYDPTKWFIALCEKIGLASHLRVFPNNEISKGRLAMKLKKLKEAQDSLDWPTPLEKLPVVSWATCSQPYCFISSGRY